MTTRAPSLADLYTEEIYQIQDRVLILLSDPWEEIPASDKTLLAKILGAINLSLDGVQIVSRTDADPVMLKNVAPKWVIRFTNDETDGDPYYTITSREGYSIIKSHPLGDLDDARKKSLWNSLKGLIQR